MGRVHIVIPAICSAMCFAEDNSSWGVEMKQAHEHGCPAVSCSMVSGSLEGLLPMPLHLREVPANTVSFSTQDTRYEGWA